jgi:hypothetical protein
MRPRSTALAVALLLAACERETPAAPADAAVRDAPAATPDAAPAPTPLCPAEPAEPVAYGRCVLDRALASRPARVAVRVATAADDAPLRAAGVTLASTAGAYALLRDADGVTALGRDPTGAMYAAMDLAERVRRDPAALAAVAPAAASPQVAFRGSNVFLVLPAAGESVWWFLDRAFWREYLDLLAAARINVLDLHGMYDPRSTLFPNALLYFATSAALPAVGIPRADRDRNVAMLREVVAMAAVRGIRVGLMSYRAYVGPADAPTPEIADVPTLTTYTREAVEDLARRVPALWRLGFRIGESGRDAQWYADTFVAGVRASGTGVGSYTRTWGADPAGIATVLRAAEGDLYVEAKFNGEHLGPPYPVAGGRMAARWRAYSYEGYLDAPPPYRFVFQVRAGGTHRVFRESSYAYLRRVMPTTTLGGAEGFSFEFGHAYFPQRDYLHAAPADRFSPWTFRRDELSYLLAGRLAYDPATPEAVFREALRARVGTDALWAPLQAAGEVVPRIAESLICGPDHREDSPDIEWHGDVEFWSQAPDRPDQDAHACNGFQGPFDPFAVASPYETAQGVLRGEPDARLTSRDVARAMLARSALAAAASTVTLDPANAEARDVARECVALADLGAYHGHKLLAATALAVYQGGGGRPWLDEARAEALLAVAAWRALVAHTAHLAPFEDNLRTTPYLFNLPRIHWRDQLPFVEGDPAAVERVAARPHADLAAPPSLAAWRDGARTSGPAPTRWDVTPATGDAAERRVTLAFAQPLPPDAVVTVLAKPFSALTDWQTVAATRAGEAFTATLPARGRGLMWAVEVRSRAAGIAMRWPDVAAETPYRVIAP